MGYLQSLYAALKAMAKDPDYYDYGSDKYYTDYMALQWAADDLQYGGAA